MTSSGVRASVSAPRGYRAWMMVLLTSAYGLNLLDRQVINVLAEPIKRDLSLADWQLGALTGLSFALLYSFAALPIARLADRGDRVKIIGASILAWSVFTAACGMAANFLQLLLLRVGVGIGEAGGAPPAQSLIADHHTPDRRSRALGIFALGSPVGAATGLALGGILAESVGWRWTLVIAGAPGVIIGLLVLLTLQEPRGRGEVARVTNQAPLASVLRSLAARPAFVYLALGAGLLSFVNYGAMAFAGSFYLRVHTADIAALGAQFGIGPLGVIGMGLGLFGAAAGAAGTYIGGALGDYFGQKDVRAYAWLPAAGSVLCASGYVIMFTFPNGGWSLFLFMVPAFFSNIWNGPATLAMQNLAGPRAKATALAVVLFVVSALGLGLGPLTMGAMSDLFAHTMGSAEGLRLAILVGLSAGALSCLSYLMASRTLGADLIATEQAETLAARTTS